MTQQSDGPRISLQEQPFIQGMCYCYLQYLPRKLIAMFTSIGTTIATTSTLCKSLTVLQISSRNMGFRIKGSGRKSAALVGRTLYTHTWSYVKRKSQTFLKNFSSLSYKSLRERWPVQGLSAMAWQTPRKRSLPIA